MVGRLYCGVVAGPKRGSHKAGPVGPVSPFLGVSVQQLVAHWAWPLPEAYQQCWKVPGFSGRQWEPPQFPQHPQRGVCQAMLQLRLLEGPGGVRTAMLERPASGGGLLLSGCQHQRRFRAGEVQGGAVCAGSLALPFTEPYSRLRVAPGGQRGHPP